MGIMNWIGDGDDDPADENVSADGGDDLFGELDSEEELGGMDDFDDDFGDVGGDDFGGGFGDASGASGGDQLFQEVENRVDSLENEVAEISSTISTVRSENEEISEAVGEIEENVRKLLEIYEMVTRGVNPFVDVEESSQMGGSAVGGNFGLFDGEGGDEEEAEEDDLDDDVMDADAESFFDDGDEGLEADAEDEGLDTDSGGDGSESDATSFQELKAEYESGEADWADGTPDQEGEREEDGHGSTTGAVEAAEEEFEFDEVVEEPAPGGRSDGKPYLETLPGGYVVDLVVMEWLEFLVEEFGGEEAVRTVEYYQRIEWISESVGEKLLAFLEGLAGVEPAEEAGPGSVELDIDDHIQSLTFISQLTGDSIQQKVVDHCAQIRGEGRGIQR